MTFDPLEDSLTMFDGPALCDLSPLTLREQRQNILVSSLRLLFDSHLLHQIYGSVVSTLSESVDVQPPFAAYQYANPAYDLTILNPPEWRNFPLWQGAVTLPKKARPPRFA